MVELKEVFERSLFLLGAGASVEAGCFSSVKMIADLEQNFGDKIQKEALQFLLSSLEYHSKWKSLQDGSFKHTANIEDLILLLRRIEGREFFLPYPITGNWADKILQLESQENNVFKNLRHQIQEKLSNWLKVGSEDISYLKPISDFLSTEADKEFFMDVFTLNYDLVFERCFNKSRGETLLNLGFSSGEWVGFSDRGAENQHRINYHKLHGSLDWFRREDGATILDSQYNEVEIIDSNENLQNAIIFGHGSKFLSIEPFISLIYEFKKQLEEKDYFFIIGYSFFDPYINNLLLEGLSKNPERNKKLIIVNPLDDIFKDLTEEDKKDSEKKNRKFADYLKFIQGSSYLSELPEFNIVSISPSKFSILQLKTGDFLNQYFSNNANNLVSLLNQYEEEAQGVF